MKERRTDPLRRRTGPKLGRRIARAVVLCAGTALFVAGLIFDAYVYVSLRSALIDEMTVQARIVAGSSSAPILFRDAAAARELLGSLQASPLVLHAEVLDGDGERLARYDAPGADTPAPTLATLRRAEGPAVFRDGRLGVRQPVREREREVGTVLVVASLAPLYQRVAAYVAMTVAATVVAFALAFVLVIRLRREVDATERRLDELAYFDAVTGLRNRHAANDTMGRLIASGEGGHGFALLLLDLDDFKMVNDTFGHGVGDELLRAVAERLLAGVHPLDLLFRYGGDEFVLLAPRTDGRQALCELAGRVLQALEMPVAVHGREIQVRCSVGVACHDGASGHMQDATRLIRAADTAMYVAKGLGKNTYAVYDPEMERDTERRMRLDADLRRAVERDELQLHYQPIVDLRSGRMVGAEALLRWRHPALGMVPPLEFIPAAEASGLIVDLGAWVLQTACHQLAEWTAAGHGDFYVAVNVSARQIRRGLIDQVQAALAASGADARQLELEITEHSMVEDIDSNVEQLSRARALGIQVAVDDFGTGLSSLAYLKRLPIGKLKIDRAFVKDLPGPADAAAIPLAILTMAERLGLTVVAEGIETEAQRDYLREQGCALAQGYFYSKPVEAAAMRRLLEVQRAMGRPPAATRQDSLAA